MQITNALKFRKWHKYFISLSLLVIFYNSYYLTICYLKFTILNQGILNWGGYRIEMGYGWFPYDYTASVTRSHITWIKINPWIPNGALLSRLDMICYRDFTPRNSYHFRSERLRWGDAFFYKDKNVAITTNGKLRIFFDHKSDLSEIIDLKDLKNKDLFYCHQNK